MSGLRNGLAATAPPGAVFKALALATATALLVLPHSGAAYAQTIGELEVRSRLGERFFGAVPVRVESGYLDPYCIKVVSSPNAPDGAQALQGARIRIGSADSVIIETVGSVTSPVVALRLEVGCENPVSRDFVVLGEGANVPGHPAAIAAPEPNVAAALEPPVAAPPPVAAAPAPARRPAARVPARRPTAAAPAAPPIAAVPTATETLPAAAPLPANRANSAAPVASASPVAAPAQAQTSQRVADLRARSDDHAAALLALEDRLTLLQKQAELLKLQLERALVNAPSAEAVSPDAATTAASKTSSGPGSTTGAPAATTTTTAAAPLLLSATPLALPSPRREPGVLDALLDWKVAGGLAALLLGAFALRRRRRPPSPAEPWRSLAVSNSMGSSPAATSPLGQTSSASEVGSYEKTHQLSSSTGFTSTALPWPAAQPVSPANQTAEWVAPPTTDTLPLPEPATSPQIQRGASGPMSREFHITQQFQPAAERVVALSSPEEIVQQARTHYMDDGDVFRAIDLLEMAVSVRKDSPRPWQALFAIYRRETMPERFQRLALAYRSSFGEDENWPAIQALGQAMEADNPLYGSQRAPAPLPDDLLERWLGVPLDFTAHLLANEMHDQLMSTYSGHKRRKKLAQ